MRDPRIDELYKKYGARIESQIESDREDYSREYIGFKQEMFKEFVSTSKKYV